MKENFNSLPPDALSKLDSLGGRSSKEILEEEAVRKNRPAYLTDQEIDEIAGSITNIAAEKFNKIQKKPFVKSNRVSSFGGGSFEERVGVEESQKQNFKVMDRIAWEKEEREKLKNEEEQNKASDDTKDKLKNLMSEKPDQTEEEEKESSLTDKQKEKITKPLRVAEKNWQDTRTEEEERVLRSVGMGGVDIEKNAGRTMVEQRIADAKEQAAELKTKLEKLKSGSDALGEFEDVKKAIEKTTKEHDKKLAFVEAEEKRLRDMNPVGLDEQEGIKGLVGDRQEEKLEKVSKV